MSSAYFQHLFGEAARSLQTEAGSRESYARRGATSPEERDVLTDRELSFLQARDSVYLASVTADGWPYVQHRGGPAGFIQSFGDSRIGLADYPGNRQYISLGNVIERGRIALFAMDYKARRRLKLIGHARIAAATDEARLVDGSATILIDVIGFDWNCPKYIEPRFTQADIDVELRPLLAENARLRAELARLQGLGTGTPPKADRS